MKLCTVEGCTAKHYSRGFCTKHYARWRAHGDPTTILTGRGLSTIDRFMARVDVSDGCWEWTGFCNEQGYAWFSVDHATSVAAYRWIYEQRVGPIPEGHQVDHRCHNADTACPGGPACPHRRCVRPDHLEAITPAENTRRRLAAGRRRVFRTHCAAGHEYPPFDESGRRRCMACRRATDRQRRAARRD